MHLEIFVEEPSAEVLVRCLIPKVLGPETSFEVHAHQGKAALLAELPQRLKAYARWLPEDWRILVLLDADSQDCRELKKRLDQIARAAGLLPKADVEGWTRLQVLNRLAIEELEAWFFGDMEAVCAAYPGVPSTLAEKRAYRDPDAIRGGTWEALERELQRVGYHAGGLAKIKAAREISIHMEPGRNRSVSFQAFRNGLLGLISGVG